jgi:HEAT repeat protein/ATP/ADP translocase
MSAAGTAAPLPLIERRALALLAGQAFFLGAAEALVYVAANTLFLVDFGSSHIPTVYIAVGVFVSLFFFGFAALQRRWSLLRLTLVAYLGEVACYLLGWLLLVVVGFWQISLALMVIYYLGVLILNIMVGGQAGLLLNVRQMKRLFPLIFACVIIGYIIGALVSPALLARLQRVADLLLVAAGCMLLVLAFFLLLFSQFREQLSRTQPGSAHHPARSLLQLLKDRYTLSLFGYQMLSAVGTQLIIYLFLTQTEVRYSDPVAMAAFFGGFAGWRNVATLLFLLLLAGRLVHRFGLKFGILANPVSAALLIALLGGVAWVTGTAVTPFFWLVIAIYVVDNLLSDGVTNTSIKAAYQVLSGRERAAVETAVEGIGVPAAFGITGVCLLIFNTIPGITLSHVILFTLLVTLVWTGAGLLAYRGYVRALITRLSRRLLQPADLNLNDGVTLPVLEKFLRYADREHKRLALRLLAAADSPALDGNLIRLLDHPDEALRVELLDMIEARGATIALPDVEMWLHQGNVSPQVKGAALRAWCALYKPVALAHVTPYLDSPEPPIRFNALVGLLRYGRVDCLATAENQLAILAQSADPTDRILAAEVIGAAQAGALYPYLLRLLQDGDVAVRRAALTAVPQSPHPELFPLVIANVAGRQTRSAALAALTDSGEASLEAIEQALADVAHQANRHRLLRLCGQIKGAHAIDLLKRQLTTAEPDGLLPALVALHAAGFRAVGADGAQIELRLVGQAAHGLRLLLALQETANGRGGGCPTAVLPRALQQEYDRLYDTIFHLLACLYDPRALLRAAGELRQPDRHRRGLALETLDVSLTRAQKGLLLPLLDESLPPAQRIQRLQRHFSLAGLAYEARLREIIEDTAAWPHEWTRACAIYTAAQNGLVELAEPIRQAQAGPALVAETAVWALRHLTQAGGEVTMLLIIEKVAILRTVDIFATIPDYVLASVAQIVEEVELAPGDTFIQEGALEDCMYIVVEGEVRVHSQGRTIITLGPGKSVGELAVLDPEPRAAAVTAVSPSLLFRLDKEPFDEVMADRPEIAQGVIRALCRRVREQGRLVASMG